MSEKNAVADSEIAAACLRAATAGGMASYLYDIASILAHGKSPAAYVAARIALGRMRHDALSMGDGNAAFLAELDRAADAEIEADNARRTARVKAAADLAKAFANLLRERDGEAEG
jgi:hypothetical protein